MNVLTQKRHTRGGQHSDGALNLRISSIPKQRFPWCTTFTGNFLFIFITISSLRPHAGIATRRVNGATHSGGVLNIPRWIFMPICTFAALFDSNLSRCLQCRLPLVRRSWSTQA